MYINPENQSPVFIIHNAILDEQKAKIIAKYKDKTVVGKHQSASQSASKLVTNKTRRNSGVYFIKDDIGLNQHIFAMIKIANHLIDYNYDLTGFELCQFTRYTKKQHYNYHVDSDAHSGRQFAFKSPEKHPLAFTDDPNLINTIRKMSCSVILNDNYEGGEFCTKILRDGELMEHTIPAVSGDMLVFPSFLNHCIKPVTKGVRYSLVQWAAGPAFK
tara:strand:+ start:497 stop:1144 length:648 start_codon:yes stop_codon:yes gene_type:complete